MWLASSAPYVQHLTSLTQMVLVSCHFLVGLELDNIGKNVLRSLNFFSFPDALSTFYLANLVPKLHTWAKLLLLLVYLLTWHVEKLSKSFATNWEREKPGERIFNQTLPFVKICGLAANLTFRRLPQSSGVRGHFSQ